MAADNLRSMTDAQWDQLQDWADRFANALWKHEPVDWEDYLPAIVDSIRPWVLQELTKIDLDYRWQHQQRKTLEDYVAEQRELGKLEQLPTDLIVEEYRIRQLHGDQPAIASYQSRFQTRFTELEAELRRVYVPPRRTMQSLNQSMTSPSIDGMNLPVGKGTPSGLSPASIDEVILEPMKVVNGYKLMEILGSGNFGQVWRAYAPGDIEVAVKEVTQASDKESAQREVDALQLVKQLRHTCLLTTQAFFSHQNQIYIVMELADGSLRDRLEQCQNEGLAGIPPDELLGYFRDAAEGLDFLHSKGLLHRDIKPDNILLQNAHAKVADFGLARQQTKPNMSVSYAGTPVYMAPEVWGGKADRASDLYSLAFSYAELRTGERPIKGDDFVQVMTGHLETAPNVSGLEPGEAEAVLKALAKKPGDRFTSCLEFVYAIEQALGPTMPTTRRRLPRLRTGSNPTHSVDTRPDTEVREQIGSTDPSWPTVGTKTDRTIVPSVVAAVPPPMSFWRSRRVPILLGTILLSALGIVTAMLFKKPREEPELPPVVVALPVNGLSMPPGFTAVPGTAKVEYLGKSWAEKAEKNGVKFMLIVPRDGQGVPFYVQASPMVRLPQAEPERNITLDQAMTTAREWGGVLPTASQWDETYLKSSSEPELKGLTNGREYTRTYDADDPKLVVVRGRLHTIPEPLTPAEWQSQKQKPFTQYANQPSRYTGYRVVIELN